MKNTTDDGPQHDIEAEMGVLGSMMLDPKCIPLVRERIGKGDFFRKSHQLIFSAVTDLFDDKGAVDLVLLRNRLEERDDLDSAGGVRYLQQIMEAVPASANVEYYVELVRNASLRRDLERSGKELRQSARDPSSDPVELRAKAISWLEEIDTANDGPEHVSGALHKALERIDKKERGEDAGSIPTRIYPVDQMTGGLELEELWVIGGLSHSGKTAFITQALISAARQGHGVLMYETELPARRISRNMACQIGGVDTAAVRQARLTKQQWKDLERATDVITDLPIWIDDDTFYLREMIADAHWQCQQKDIDVIAVDHAQRLRVSEGTQKWEKMENVAVGLKQLSRKTGTCVLCASQMTDKGEGFGPRGGQELRNESDIFATLQFPDDVVFGEKADDANTHREFVLSKLRGGGQDEERLKFFGPHLTFSAYN